MINGLPAWFRQLKSAAQIRFRSLLSLLPNLAYLCFSSFMQQVLICHPVIQLIIAKAWYH
jgi:hypothetical protein